MVNVIGAIACADLEKLEYTFISERCGEGAAPLLLFQSLKIDPAKVGEQLLFILAESPGTIIVSERVVGSIRTKKSDDEWGLTRDEKT